MLTSLVPSRAGFAAVAGTLAGIVGRKPSIGGVPDFAAGVISGRAAEEAPELGS